MSAPWTHVEVIAPVFTKFAISEDGDGKLVLVCVPNGDQNTNDDFPKNVPIKCGINQILPGYTRYVVDDDGKPEEAPSKVQDAPVPAAKSSTGAPLFREEMASKQKPVEVVDRLKKMFKQEDELRLASAGFQSVHTLVDLKNLFPRGPISRIIDGIFPSGENTEPLWVYTYRFAEEIIDRDRKSVDQEFGNLSKISRAAYILAWMQFNELARKQRAESPGNQGGVEYPITLEAQGVQDALNARSTYPEVIGIMTHLASKFRSRTLTERRQLFDELKSLSPSLFALCHKALAEELKLNDAEEPKEPAAVTAEEQKDLYSSTLEAFHLTEEYLATLRRIRDKLKLGK